MKPLHSSSEKSKIQLFVCLQLDEMRDVILPRDELLRKKLDREYIEEELRYEHPKLKSQFFRENPVSVDKFEHQVGSHVSMIHCDVIIMVFINLHYTCGITPKHVTSGDVLSAT